LCNMYALKETEQHISTDLVEDFYTLALLRRVVDRRLYAPAHTHTHTHTERERERERERQRERINKQRLAPLRTSAQMCMLVDICACI